MANILITGATAGIGRAAAILLANRGHTVIATGRNPEALAALDRLQPSLFAVPLDVTDVESIHAARAQVDSLLEGAALDVLVNNAGWACVGPLELTEPHTVAEQFNTNVFGLLRVTHAFLPAMRERGAGRVVNISSVAGDFTMPFHGAYAASKHAIESMSDALREELRPHGIKVVLVKPGAVKTGFGAAERELLQAYAETSSVYRQQLETFMRFHRQLHSRGADPVSVAGVIVTACEAARPHPRYITPWLQGRAIILLRRLLPTRLRDWLARRIIGL